MAESDRPRMPRPAATGIASASSPISSARVTPSMSATAFAVGAFLEVADLVLDLLLGRTRADGPPRAGVVAAHDHAERVEEQQNPHDHKAEQAANPKRLRDDGRRLQRGLAARARGPGFRHHAEAVPG